MPTATQVFASALVTEQEIAASEIQIAGIAGRHAGLRIERATGQPLHVKQAFTPHDSAALAHEAQTIRLLSSAPDEWVRALTPTLHAYDADAAMLATEFVPNGRTLHHCVVEAPSAALEAATALGRGLARLHGSGGVARALEAAPCPDVLGLHRPTPALLRRFSVAGLRLVELVQEYSDFGPTLDHLRATWAPVAPVHNDVKWDNLVVSIAPDSGRYGRVTLVDWESAGLGDPGWDIGSFFAAGLAAWARTQPDHPDQVTGDELPTKPYPLTLIQLLCRAFWSSYHQQRTAEPPLGQTTMRYCAARLVQTALELTQNRLELPGESTRLLQLALNIVQHPAEAATVLLGLELGGSATARPATALEDWS